MTDENDKAMRDMTDKELQDESGWDFESAEQLAPREQKARAVVSVAFPGDAFDFVSDADERSGMKISHFIREAAFEKAKELAELLPNPGYAVSKMRDRGPTKRLIAENFEADLAQTRVDAQRIMGS